MRSANESQFPVFCRKNLQALYSVLAQSILPYPWPLSLTVYLVGLLLEEEVGEGHPVLPAAVEGEEGVEAYRKGRVRQSSTIKYNEAPDCNEHQKEGCAPWPEGGR